MGVHCKGVDTEMILLSFIIVKCHVTVKPKALMRFWPCLYHFPGYSSSYPWLQVRVHA